MLCYLSPVQCYQSLKKMCWWLQGKVGVPMASNAVLAVKRSMKVLKGGNLSVLSFARIEARCYPAWCSSDHQIGRTLCRCSEEKFFGPAVNAACSCPQLVGPRGRDLEGRQPRGGEVERSPWRSEVERVEGVEWEKGNNEGAGVLTIWSEGGLSPWPIVAQTWILHLGVKNGEFWDIEFISESILKSTMNDFICGSHQIPWKIHASSCMIHDISNIFVYFYSTEQWRPQCSWIRHGKYVRSRWHYSKKV